MKKQSFKLKLKKENVSNLNAIKGGGGAYSVAKFCIDTFTAVGNVCCDQTYPDSQMECRTITPGGTCAFHCNAPKTQIGETC
ncbi:hypothetical protein [Kordia sp.]|uniref:hypothetical protein n=1 Tax=Kordia sp. TaxID=1965332 RepID=UPI003B595582